MYRVCQTSHLDHRVTSGRSRQGWLFYAIVVLLLTTHGEAFAQVGKVYPVDESGKDRSFASFRTRLIDALKRRDRDYLMKIVHPKVKNNFGGDGGRAEFVAQWHPENRKSEVWDVLLTALKLGGTFEGKGDNKQFCAPYVFTRLPKNLDPFEYQVIIAKNVPVRAEPSASAQVKQTLSFDVVQVAPPHSEDEEWVKVILKSGEGYVHRSQIRSAVGYRVCFQRVRGKWMLMFLVAGD